MQRLDEGLFDEFGAPLAKTTDSGQMLEAYSIFHGDTELDCGQFFSDYGIPQTATISVVRRQLGDDERHSIKLAY